MTAPVGAMPNTCSEPWPCCQNSTVAPKVAATETTLSSTAFTGSRIDRNVRTSSRNVTSAISPRLIGNFL